jgi:hypothetical protein
MAENQNISDVAGQETGLPLFFQSPHALDNVRHKTAAILPTAGFGFARTTNSIPLSAVEFVEASHAYPIVFTPGEHPAPVVIVGLERENYFVEKDGSWKKDSYIPAYVRQYPFVLFDRAEDKKFYLCIDEAAPHYRTTGSENTLPLYKSDGSPSDATESALQFCTAFYQQHLLTRQFCADLATYNLLVPYQSDVTLKDSRKLHLGGFQIIDEKRLSALPDDVFLTFRRKGWLPFIILALASTASWKRLINLAA